MWQVILMFLQYNQNDNATEDENTNQDENMV